MALKVTMAGMRPYQGQKKPIKVSPLRVSRAVIHTPAAGDLFSNFVRFLLCGRIYQQNRRLMLFLIVQTVENLQNQDYTTVGLHLQHLQIQIIRPVKKQMSISQLTGVPFL